MTSQTRCFIELSDLVGMQLECRKCGISLLASGDSLASLSSQHDVTMSKCPTCNHPWTVPNTYPTQMGFDTEVKKLLRDMEMVRSIEDKLGCKIRFELKGVASGDLASETKA